MAEDYPYEPRTCFDDAEGMAEVIRYELLSQATRVLGSEEADYVTDSAEAAAMLLNRSELLRLMRLSEADIFRVAKLLWGVKRLTPRIERILKCDLNETLFTGAAELVESYVQHWLSWAEVAGHG